MTAEQIAELRRLEREVTGLPWPWRKRPVYDDERDAALAAAARNALPRLLDEREALLEALRVAATKLGDARSVLAHCWAREEVPDKESVDDADVAEDVARASIAKAEAP